MSQKCPKCQAKTKCIDSRHRYESGHTYRRYRCVKCDTRFSTAEFIVTNLEEVEKMSPRLAKEALVAHLIDVDSIRKIGKLVNELKDTIGKVGL